MRNCLKKCFIFWLGLAGLLFVLPVKAGVVEKLHTFLQSTHSLQANFSQVVTAQHGKKSQLATGSVMISRPGKFRWQIDKPYNQLLVGDGERIWIYDPDLYQVTVRRMDKALGSTPAALLIGNERLDKTFDLRALEAREGLEWVEAIPKSQEGGFEKLHIGFSGNELKAMEFFDNFGQVTRILFSNQQRNIRLSPSLFTFTPPEGADVIGE